jgi:hypothetical protein
MREVMLDAEIEKHKRAEAGMTIKVRLVSNLRKEGHSS